MPLTCTLRLSFPPTVNTYYHHVGTKVLLSAPGRQYRTRVAEEVMVQWSGGRWQAETGRLRVWIEVFPPDQRVRDLDNLTKSLLDALQHAGVYPSDGQIDDLRLLRRPSEGKPGHVVVFVSAIAPEKESL